MRVGLGIDQAMGKTGVAIIQENLELVDVACISLARSGDARLYELAERLTAFAAYPIFWVAMEGLSLGSVNRLGLLGEVSGAVKLWSQSRLGLLPLVVAPSQLKLFATGKGQASKAQVVRYAVSNHGAALEQLVPETAKAWKEAKGQADPVGHDMADAITLAEIAVLAGTSQRPRTRAQAEVLKKLKADK